MVYLRNYQQGPDADVRGTAIRCKTLRTSLASSTRPILEKVLHTDRMEWFSSVTDVWADFRAMVERSMPLVYAMKHFAPHLQAVIK